MAESQQVKKLTGSFLKASYTDNQQLSLSRSQSSSSAPRQSVMSNRESVKSSATLAQINKSNIKKIEIKKQDHTIRTLLCIAAVIIFAILCIDINSEIKRQWHRHQLQAQHCFTQYMTNQCDNAVEVVRQKCKQLQICYSTPVKDKIKISALLGHLIGSGIKSLTSSAGIFGTIFLVLVICIVLYFAYKSSKASITFQKH